MKALVKNKNGNMDSFPSLFDDFFMRDLFNFPMKSHLQSNQAPAVNVKETEKDYTLELAVPGMKKEDFNISVEDDMLVVSSETKKEATDEHEGYTRKEFSYSSFSRSFRLPENGVEVNKIKAKYQDGVLSLELPKVAEEQRSNKKVIKVS